MRSVAEVKADISGCIQRGEHEMEAGYPYENPLNDLQRELIAAYAAEHGGEAWLGEVNLYCEKGQEPEHVITKWDGDLVLNFGARFVLPAYDEALNRMILDRHRAPYTGTSADYERIKSIHARIYELKGELLIWN